VHLVITQVAVAVDQDLVGKAVLVVQGVAELVVGAVMDLMQLLILVVAVAALQMLQALAVVALAEL
jgi:hypothetical protein